MTRRGRQTVIVATCDPTADNPTFQVKGEIRTLVYELDITTKYACGGGGPSPPSPGPPPPGPPSPGPPSPTPACVINSVDYGFLANNQTDYVVPSTSYNNYEFLFNVCRDLVWSEGACPKGSSVCERLTTTQTATDVYGKHSTQTSGVDVDTRLPYFEFKGDACLFGSGQPIVTMTSRVYLACGEKREAEVVYESYFNCEVHVKVSDPRMCPPPTPPSPRPGSKMRPCADIHQGTGSTPEDEASCQSWSLCKQHRRTPTFVPTTGDRKQDACCCSEPSDSDEPAGDTDKFCCAIASVPEPSATCSIVDIRPCSQGFTTATVACAQALVDAKGCDIMAPQNSSAFKSCTEIFDCMQRSFGKSFGKCCNCINAFAAQFQESQFQLDRTAA